MFKMDASIQLKVLYLSLKFSMSSTLGIYDNKFTSIYISLFVFMSTPCTQHNYNSKITWNERNNSY